MDNPWQAQHRADEMAFTDGEYSRARANAAVDFEYESAPAPVDCEDPCDGTAYYKATIGALKCTTCGALYDTNGIRY